MNRPALSVIVIGFDMAHEPPRPVTSLPPPCQAGGTPDEVEIVPRLFFATSA